MPSDLKITGNVTVAGDVTLTGGDVIADGISLKTHLHVGNLGGTTPAPTQTPASIPDPAIITGDLEIDGKSFSSHTHSQANDSNGDIESNTSSPL